jgi:hypothetical protein
MVGENLPTDQLHKQSWPGIYIWSECFSQPLSDRYPEDEDRDGVQNVGLLTAQPFDPADSPRELHHHYHVSVIFVLM